MDSLKLSVRTDDSGNFKEFFISDTLEIIHGMLIHIAGIVKMRDSYIADGRVKDGVATEGILFSRAEI